MPPAMIFSHFLKITFNNVVKKFAKMHERKVAYKKIRHSNNENILITM